MIPQFFKPYRKIFATIVMLICIVLSFKVLVNLIPAVFLILLMRWAAEEIRPGYSAEFKSAVWKKMRDEVASNDE